MRQVLKEAFLVAMVGGLMPYFLCRGIERLLDKL